MNRSKEFLLLSDETIFRESLQVKSFSSSISSDVQQLTAIQIADRLVSKTMLSNYDHFDLHSILLSRYCQLGLRSFLGQKFGVNLKF